MSSSNRFLLLCNPVEYTSAGAVPVESYLPYFKSCTHGATVFVWTKKVTTLFEIEAYCKEKNIRGVFTNQELVLEKLSRAESPKISNYEGSYFQVGTLEYVIIAPLAQLATVPEGKFLTSRYTSKLITPAAWKEYESFSWQLLGPENIESFYENYVCGAVAIACDIETIKDPLAIRCIGYTCIHNSAGTFTFKSGVIPIKDDFSLAWMRKINGSPAPKIFQKGRYDLAYLQRYNAAVHNYLWDTSNLFHAWYSELDKDLATLSAFFVRKARYWKDLANTSDLMEYYKYNALDTYNTALVFLQWIAEAPEWAKVNYVKQFPLQYPCHLVEMQGMKRDSIRRAELEKTLLAEIEEDEKKLARMLGIPGFNPGSAKQVKLLLTILGCGDIKSTNEKDLKKAIYRHPFNAFILNKIIKIREKRKLCSTYLCEGNELPGTNRLLFSLNPDGTDTGRMASRDHPFWCGMNIQNWPAQDMRPKETIIADEGFAIAEGDLEQAESRDMAHIAGDEKLIAAVTGPRDFHTINIVEFTGQNYDDLYNSEKKKTKNKPLRDIFKRVNHGVTYVMGPGVLVDTMGMDSVDDAKRLLKLPKQFDHKEVTNYLIEKFHSIYPGLRANLYTWVKATVANTKMIVGPTGWTRYCFKDPLKDKRAFNSYVAHMGQHTNAQKLNTGYMRVFYEIALHPEHRKNFRLGPQIHDSIWHQFRTGHRYLSDMVAKCMEVPLTVKGCDGKVRSYTVPVAVKAGKNDNGAQRWSDTE